MASTSAISGLVSGLDTKTLISQLMTLAKAPQDKLKTQLASNATETTAAQSINSKAASMTSLAKELAAAKTYTTASASSSDSSVSATAASTAGSGSVSFIVTDVAAAYQALTPTVPTTTSTDDLVFSITPTSGSTSASPISLTAASANAEDIAAAINGYTGSTPLGVTAQVIKDGANQRLLLTSTTTGQASTFTTSGITSTSGNDALTDVQYGKDARIELTGASGSSLGSAVLTSSTNTFTSLMPGVDVTVSAQTTKAVTVSTSVNQSAITSKVSALVTAMNNVLSDVAFHTKALAVGTTASATNGGLLRGNSTMRDLANQTLNAVSSGSATSTTNATFAGLSVTKDGQVTFDASTFGTLYAKDPAQAAAVLQKFAAAVQTVGSGASDPTNGTVTSFITGNQTEAKTLTTSIAGWDERLDLKQARLQAQYNALETALSKLKSQSDSLTSSLAAFTSSNSN